MKLTRVIHKLSQYFKTQYGKNFSRRQKFVNCLNIGLFEGVIFVNLKRRLIMTPLTIICCYVSLLIFGVSGYSSKWFDII